MDKRKKLALNLLMAAMSMSAVSGIVACNETSPADYGEEYVITLSDSSFVLVMDDKTELGTYTYDGSSFSMSYGESASLADDVLTIVHSGNTYHFLKKVNYTVSFDVDGGSAITDKMVMNGKTLAKPASKYSNIQTTSFYLKILPTGRKIMKTFVNRSQTTTVVITEINSIFGFFCFYAIEIHK